jgi:adenylylsulfate kinase-like enzyme
MKTVQPTLIIIRGNSGSGKSTLAREVRLRMVENGMQTALVEQDYLRRIILKEKDIEGGDNILLIEQTVEFALAKGYSVVLEGILASSHYEQMLRRLVAACDRSFIYYMDVPFQETVRRHLTKHNSDEFGEKEMKEWWQEGDVLGVVGEKILPTESTVKESLELIVRDVEP